MHNYGEMESLLSVKLKSNNVCLVLGISDFISHGNQAVSKFKLVVSQVQKNERDIESKLQSIAMANLLKYQVPDNSKDLPSKIIYLYINFNVKLNFY